MTTTTWTTTTTWITVCRLDDVQPERGVAVLLGDQQIAVFRTFDDHLHALSNVDPFTGVAVLSRGIVGDRGGEPTVASPLYKQVFSLVTGACLDAPDVVVPTFPVRASNGTVQIAVQVERS
jgi:nitrite reductase (NADH) small subunit